MNRRFNIGDQIICIKTGVVGKCIKFYTPTAQEEQTMVLTEDGRKYHAPTFWWKRVSETNDLYGYEKEDNIDTSTILNPYEKYLLEFAQTHGLSIDEAVEHPMVKARLHFFNETGL